MVERVTERTDGVTAERVTETDTSGSTVVVERRGSGAGLLIGLAVLILVVVGALYLVNQNSREDAKAQAITGAIDKAGDAAKDVGDAAKEATKPAE